MDETPSRPTAAELAAIAERVAGELAHKWGHPVLNQAIHDRQALLAEVAALRAALSGHHDETRALVIEMRRYMISHSMLIGECVAWTRLKQHYSVATTAETWVADLAWLAAYRATHPAGPLP